MSTINIFINTGITNSLTSSEINEDDGIQVSINQTINTTTTTNNVISDGDNLIFNLKKVKDIGKADNEKLQKFQQLLDNVDTQKSNITYKDAKNNNVTTVYDLKKIKNLSVAENWLNEY